MTTHSRPLFDALGTPGSSEVFKPYEGGHANVVTRPDLISDIPDWLDKYSGRVK